MNPLAARPLPTSFYDRPVQDVARDLLGAFLVRTIGGQRLVGRIVETEAYGGPEDLASHASRSRSGRAAVMFGPPGRAYVYLIYGIHHCLNVVTGPEGTAEAVLIRALEPIEGISVRTDGPGRLARALAIDRALNGARLDGEQLRIAEPAGEPFEIATGRRIGVDYAGEWADRPWRFWISGNRHVSARSVRGAPRR